MKTKIIGATILAFGLAFQSLSLAQEAEKPKDSGRVKEKTNKKLIREEKKKGGDYYEAYVNALHSKRYQNEFTPAEWKTILLQKRVRVPLTADEHHYLLLFFGD